MIYTTLFTSLEIYRNTTLIDLIDKCTDKSSTTSSERVHEPITKVAGVGVVEHLSAAITLLYTAC